MTVTLNREARRFVEEKVRAGQYVSPDAAVNAMVELAQEQEKWTADDVAELRAEIDVGLREANRGDFIDYTAEDIIAEGRAALDAKRAKA